MSSVARSVRTVELATRVWTRTYCVRVVERDRATSDLAPSVSVLCTDGRGHGEKNESENWGHSPLLTVSVRRPPQWSEGMEAACLPACLPACLHVCLPACHGNEMLRIA